MTEPTQVLNSVISVLLRQETATWGGCDLGNSGVWDGDYGWGVRVRRHLAHAEGVLYGMELGSVTLKNKQPTHTPHGFSTSEDFTVLAVLDEKKLLKVIRRSLPHCSKLGNSQKVHGRKFSFGKPPGRVVFLKTNSGCVCSQDGQYLALPIPHLRVQTSQMPVHMLRFYQMT